MGQKKAVYIDKENKCINRIIERCIECGICKKTCIEKEKIDRDIYEKTCLGCGQCILSCPVGALTPKYQYKKVLDYLHDTNKVVTISLAPAVRVSLREAFGYDEDENNLPQLIGALKRIGFDYVFDVTFGADLTVMEEATEFLGIIMDGEHRPLFTSCCPAWVSYVTKFYPQYTCYLSTAKSPIGMQGAILNSYFLEKENLKKEDVIHVVVAPCTAKKQEIIDVPGMDICITTSELLLLLKEENVNLKEEKERNFDALLSEGSGAATIFGRKGGVSEAVLRTLSFLMGEPFKIKTLEETESKRVLEVKTYRKTLKVASVWGMKEVGPILEALENGEVLYDFVEVMNCENGCVGGGGQPLGTINLQSEQTKKRMNNLSKLDRRARIRCSHENMDVKQVYDMYFMYPNSPLAKAYLHRDYFTKKSIIEEDSSDIEVI